MRDLCTIFRDVERDFLRATITREIEDEGMPYDEVLRVIDEDQEDNDPLYRE